MIFFHLLCLCVTFYKVLFLFYSYIGFRYRQHRRKTSEKLIVDTVYGPVRGVKRISCWNDAFYSFERIPFAKPPVGELRFADPLPPEPWTKPLNATKEAQPPLQFDNIFKRLKGEEDCLYLNVYTTDVQPSTPKPVVIWIYGGGFELGGATKVIYSPDYFMHKDVIFVTFNYRVGALGFLSLKDPSLQVPGNAGLKDQIMALKWVKNNAARFGGDPDNITVFGESAGGASAHFLMLTEQTKGLFHKAILMSGTAHMYWAIVPDRDWAYRLAKRLGYKGDHNQADILSFLKSSDGKAICKANTKLLTAEERRNRLHFPHGPVIEPYNTEQCVIPKHPRLMARDTWSNTIPLIVGANSFEGLLLYPKVKEDPSVLEEIEDCEYLVPMELGLDRKSEECKKNTKPTLFSYLNEPQPPEPWTKVKNCGRESPMPLQYNFVLNVTHGTEDCLYLNVYSPKIHTNDLKPVMVWIYGGGFQMGAANRMIYGPDYFMQKGVILVSINYRVGPLGFLSLKDPNLKIPGNAGLKDQILGLRWVKANIKNFGGDPDNVTLFGESAGGAAAHYLMLTPQTKGLFHKAILMSGTAFCPWAHMEDTQSAYRLAKKIGYCGEDNDERVLNYLRKAFGLIVVNANGRLLTKDERQHGSLFVYGPVVEPYETDQCVISRHPVEMARDAWSNSIPVIIGGCANEGYIFYMGSLKSMHVVAKKLNIEKEVGDCEKLIPDCAKDVFGKQNDHLALKEMYFGTKEVTMFPFLELLGHKHFWQPIRRTAHSRLSFSSAPTYVYRFAIDSPFNMMRRILCDAQKTGTCHGDDLLYLFYGLLTLPISTESREYSYIHRMVGMWTQFAKIGNPNISETEPVEWKPADKSEAILKCLNISDTVSIVDLPDKKYLDFWDSFYPNHLLI